MDWSPVILVAAGALLTPFGQLINDFYKSKREDRQGARVEIQAAKDRAAAAVSARSESQRQAVYDFVAAANDVARIRLLIDRHYPNRWPPNYAEDFHVALAVLSQAQFKVRLLVPSLAAVGPHGKPVEMLYAEAQDPQSADVWESSVAIFAEDAIKAIDP